MLGDHVAGTTATPLHVTLSVLSDGTINPSVGVAFNAQVPSGAERRVDVEVPLAGDPKTGFDRVLTDPEITQLTGSLQGVFHVAVAREGIEELSPVPVAPAPPAAAQGESDEHG